MSITNFTIIFIAVFLSAVGQIFLKIAANTIGPISLKSNVLELLSLSMNIYLLLGLMSYFISTVIWIVALSRVTQCFGGEGLNILSAGNMALIGMYNCMFSIAGMALVSIISIIGLYFLVKSSDNAARFFLPLIFSLLMFIGVFQQSLSVHLIGLCICCLGSMVFI